MAIASPSRLDERCGGTSPRAARCSPARTRRHVVNRQAGPCGSDRLADNPGADGISLDRPRGIHARSASSGRNASRVILAVVAGSGRKPWRAYGPKPPTRIASFTGFRSNAPRSGPAPNVREYDSPRWSQRSTRVSFSLSITGLAGVSRHHDPGVAYGMARKNS